MTNRFLKQRSRTRSAQTHVEVSNARRKVLCHRVSIKDKRKTKPPRLRCLLRVFICRHWKCRSTMMRIEHEDKPLGNPADSEDRRPKTEDIYNIHSNAQHRCIVSSHRWNLHFASLRWLAPGDEYMMMSDPLVHPSKRYCFVKRASQRANEARVGFWKIPLLNDAYTAYAMHRRSRFPPSPAVLLNWKGITMYPVIVGSHCPMLLFALMSFYIASAFSRCIGFFKIRQ